jgi:hypothetical protein
MSIRHLFVLIVLVALPIQAAATELILPVFALNHPHADGSRWSTEIYLVNPNPRPVQVSLAGLLPGKIERPAPCGQFMSQTRVVPPQSAVVWTASGLATDLGCAVEALGALKLRADGPIRVTGRLVNHPDHGEKTPLGVLSGGGQQIAALPTARLPGPTTFLLPALLWHRNPCGDPAFTTVVGFANPGTEPVSVTLYLPEERRRAIRVNRRTVALPHQIVVEPHQWKQISIAPRDRGEGICLEPESFDLEIVTDGPLAVYGSVTDRGSMDARFVEPVDLHRN